MEVTENSCRVCLSEKKHLDSEIWRSITDADDHDNKLKISDKIEICSGVIIDMDSDLAKLICQPCIISLKSAYDFRINCRNSENIIEKCIRRTRRKGIKKVSYKNENYEVQKDDKIESPSIEQLSSQRLPLSAQDISDEDAAIKLENFYPEVKVEIENEFNTAEENIAEGSSSDEYEPAGDDFSPDDESDIEYKPKTKTAEKKKIIEEKPIKEKKPRERKLPKEKYKNAKEKLPKEEKTFVCELCGNVYKKRALLTDHMRWHSGNKDFKCEICGKAFLLNTYLARHIRTHTGIRNYKCNFCSRTFYTNGLKRAHEKVHTGERCYKCELCERTFSYSQSLQRHMLVHSGVKPHKCQDCGKEFRQESHLKQHLATNIHQAKQQQVNNQHHPQLQQSSLPMPISHPNLQQQLLPLV